MMEEQVREAIEAIRPAIQNDGGDIKFVDMKDTQVTIKLTGACIGCPLSEMTLKGGVERYLQHAVDPSLVVELDDDPFAM